MPLKGRVCRVARSSSNSARIAPRIAWKLRSLSRTFKTTMHGRPRGQIIWGFVRLANTTTTPASIQRRRFPTRRCANTWRRPFLRCRPRTNLLSAARHGSNGQRRHCRGSKPFTSEKKGCGRSCAPRQALRTSGARLTFRGSSMRRPCSALRCFRSSRPSCAARRGSSACRSPGTWRTTTTHIRGTVRMVLAATTCVGPRLGEAIPSLGRLRSAACRVRSSTGWPPGAGSAERHSSRTRDGPDSTSTTATGKRRPPFMPMTSTTCTCSQSRSIAALRMRPSRF